MIVWVSRAIRSKITIVSLIRARHPDSAKYKIFDLKTISNCLLVISYHIYMFTRIADETKVKQWI